MSSHIKIYGIVGKNITYTLSPVMQNAAFKYFEIPAEYRIFDLREDDVERFVNDVSANPRFGGFNVTVPYKIRMKEIIEAHGEWQLSKDASLLGAVNTVKVDGGKFTGYNTDGKGFNESLLEETGLDVRGKNILMLGAGGAGRAIAVYLASLKNKPAKIMVYDVDQARAASVLAILKEKFGPSIGEPVEKDQVDSKVRISDLVVNASPLGTKDDDPVPLNVEALRKDAVLYDLVYCRETKIVRRARERGIVAVNGLGMLVNQGAVAFNIWTNVSCEEARGVMRQALESKLKGHT